MIELISQISITVKNAIASIANLTTGTTPKANDGELVDSALSWNGDVAQFSDNVELQKILLLTATTQLGDAGSQWLGTFDDSVVINAQTGKSVILAINAASILSVLAGGIDVTGSITASLNITSRGNIQVLPVGVNSDAQVIITPTGTGNSYVSYGANLLFSNGITFDNTGAVFIANMKSGASQGAAGAAANELWRDTADNSVKLGV